jgi:1-acyl-sn-glycerol-3-phosphate acyltransferase
MSWEFRPARDMGLSQMDRLRSHAREVGFRGAAVQWCWRRLVRHYLRLFHRLEVIGLEHLPPGPPFILVANHSSHLDALTLAAVLRGTAARRAFSLAAGEVFFGSARASVFAAYAVNALPVWRRRTSTRDLAGLRERLLQDALVYILFPEGTRSRDGTMGRFLPGVGALIAGSPAPVVPCHLEGAFQAWPATRRLPRPGKLVLRIGAPLSFAELSNDKAGWLKVAQDCETAVAALGPQAGPKRAPPSLDTPAGGTVSPQAPPSV